MFYIVCNMNWFDIWNQNAKRDIELHKRNGYNFLSEEQYNKMCHELLKPLNLNENMSVLDTGCGVGAISKIISSYNVKHLTGIDYVQASVDIASKNMPQHTFYCNSIDNMKDVPDNYYDVVVSNGVFIYLNNESAKKALEEIKRVLKNGGNAYIGDLNDINKKDVYNKLRVMTHTKKSPDQMFFNNDFFKVDGFELFKTLSYSDTDFSSFCCTSPYRFAVYLKKVI